MNQNFMGCMKSIEEEWDTAEVAKTKKRKPKMTSKTKGTQRIAETSVGRIERSIRQTPQGIAGRNMPGLNPKAHRSPSSLRTCLAMLLAKSGTKDTTINSHPSQKSAPLTRTRTLAADELASRSIDFVSEGDSPLASPVERDTM